MTTQELAKAEVSTLTLEPGWAAPSKQTAPHGPYLHELSFSDVARHLRQYPNRSLLTRYEAWLKKAGRVSDYQRFRRLMRAYFLPDDADDVQADAASIHMAALALKNDSHEQIDQYCQRLDSKEARYVRTVIADPNPPPDESSGLGDWTELQAWSRKEEMVTAYVGFSTAPWYGVINRRAVRRQYQVLTSRIGGRSFWASGWVYLTMLGAGMGTLFLLGLVILILVDESQVTYSIKDGQPVAEIGHWFNWWWVMAFTASGSLFTVAGWPITMWKMWQVAFADLYALQLQATGTRLKYKLKFKTAILNHAANSQAFGGATGRGGGLRGGYAVHITRENLMGMPARKVLELPLRGGNDPQVKQWLDDGQSGPDPLDEESATGDAIQTLLADGDHLFDGAQARATSADASMIQRAGEIKQQWAKKRQGRQIPMGEVGGWLVVLIMVVFLYLQVQSGYTLTNF